VEPKSPSQHQIPTPSRIHGTRSATTGMGQDTLMVTNATTSMCALFAKAYIR